MDTDPGASDSGPETPFIDRAHRSTFEALWRSAMFVDRSFGSDLEPAAYQHIVGSIAPAVLYDQAEGMRPRMRFSLDVPLPRLDERFHAFIGRVNRDEYVSERKQASGAFASQYGHDESDDTLLGVLYRDPRNGAGWELDAGLRIRSPLDPYVKACYRILMGDVERVQVRLRETFFWQNSEKLGMTSRVDVERLVGAQYLLRGTLSGTLSERTEGVRGYSALTLLRALPNRRAAAAEVFSQHELDDDVPLRNYGVKAAYRQSVSRDWLVVEGRVTLSFPRESPAQQRQASWGVGIGVEMFFGTDEFLARPVTF